MSEFRNFLLSNTKRIRESNLDVLEKGTALVDAWQSELLYLYGVLKVGIIFARLHGLTPIAYPSERCSRRNMAIIKSLFRCRVRSTWMFSSITARHGIGIAWRVLKLRRKEDIVEIDVDGAKIGPYIYDACYRPLQAAISWRQRLKIAYLLIWHVVDREVIVKYNVRMVLIGDPAYRTGMLFELCRARQIPCVNAINIDECQMHKCFTRESMAEHYRCVSEYALSRLKDVPAVEKNVDQYFSARIMGAIRQHDVIRAFAADKKRYSKGAIFEQYNLKEGLPLVFVMAHVLTDAPHAYSPTLYIDYEEWVLSTVVALSKNKRVNFLIKEHPSVELYNEKGILRDLLSKVGLQSHLVAADMHTESVIRCADSIITCGGTIGIEASVNGIPTVLAGTPPYSGRLFTVEPQKTVDYEQLLFDGIENLSRLSEEQISEAKRVAYVMFQVLDNSDPSLEFGQVPFRRGERFNEEQFFRNVIEGNAIPLEEQCIYKKLREFDASADTLILNTERLRNKEA